MKKTGGEMNEILNDVDSDYGILISKTNKIIYEKYQNNKPSTRFRVFSMSKPITGYAIMALVQMNKLKLNDTIDKFNIDIKYANEITILHLLQHSSGVYDFASELFFKQNPKELFDSIQINNTTKFIDIYRYLNEMKKKPQFRPMKTIKYHKKNYNNTGYDLLGYIIYLVTAQ